MSAFKDHFSAQAEGYVRYRPGYPAALYEFLASVAPGRRQAWDCATGGGLAAAGLAEHFERVTASDASLDLLSRALRHPRVRYLAGLAEQVPLRSGSIELAIVAQALHWLDLERFYDEVRRVLRPGGVLAAWTYGRPSVGAPVDAILERFHRRIGPFWPPERRFVDEGYRTLAFPLARLEAPGFEVREEWELARFAGYVGTWSGVRGYVEAKGQDPVPALKARLSEVWGRGDGKRTIRWPIRLLVGRAGPD